MKCMDENKQQALPELGVEEILRALQDQDAMLVAIHDRLVKLEVSAQRSRAAQGKRKSACTQWTAEEERRLRDVYPHIPVSDVVKLFPGRTRSSIISRAHSLGIKGVRTRTESPGE